MINEPVSLLVARLTITSPHAWSDEFIVDSHSSDQQNCPKQKVSVISPHFLQGEKRPDHLGSGGKRGTDEPAIVRSTIRREPDASPWVSRSLVPCARYRHSEQSRCTSPPVARIPRTVSPPFLDLRLGGVNLLRLLSGIWIFHRVSCCSWSLRGLIVGRKLKPISLNHDPVKRENRCMTGAGGQAK